MALIPGKPKDILTYVVGLADMSIPMYHFIVSGIGVLIYRKIHKKKE